MALRDPSLESRFRALAREMIDAFVACPPPQTIQTADISRAALSDVEAAAVMYGWTCRIARTAQAVLLLDEAGFGVEASPLVRSMIEHATALWWLEEARGPAYQSLVRSRARSMELFNRAQQDGWSLDGATQRLLDEAIAIETDEDTRSQDNLNLAGPRAVKFGLGAFHQAWLVETWTSHPSIMSAQAYYAIDGLTVLLYPVPLDRSRETAAAVASVLHTALVAYERLVPGAFDDRLNEWQTRFEDLASQMAGG